MVSKLFPNGFLTDSKKIKILIKKWFTNGLQFVNHQNMISKWVTIIWEYKNLKKKFMVYKWFINDLQKKNFENHTVYKHFQL